MFRHGGGELSDAVGGLRLGFTSMHTELGIVNKYILD